MCAFSRLKGRFERDHSVAACAFLVIARDRAEEVEILVRNNAAFDRQFEFVRELPLHARAGANFAVGQHRVVQLRIAPACAEAVIRPEARAFQICAGINCQRLAHFILETRRRHDGIEHPLRSEAPADAAAGKDR